MFYDSRRNLTGNSSLAGFSGNSFMTAVTAMSYDQYGNTVQATDAAGITTTTTYDSTYAQYPITQVTAMFTNSSTFDFRSGAALTAIDAKGLVASNSYDVFYRPTASYISTNALRFACFMEKAGQLFAWRHFSGGVSYNYVHKQVNDAVDPSMDLKLIPISMVLGGRLKNVLRRKTVNIALPTCVYDNRRQLLITKHLLISAPAAGFTIPSGTYLGDLTEFDSLGPRLSGHARRARSVHFSQDS